MVSFDKAFKLDDRAVGTCIFKKLSSLISFTVNFHMKG